MPLSTNISPLKAAINDIKKHAIYEVGWTAVDSLPLPQSSNSTACTCRSLQCTLDDDDDDDGGGGGGADTPTNK